MVVPKAVISAEDNASQKASWQMLRAAVVFPDTSNIINMNDSLKGPQEHLCNIWALDLNVSHVNH